MAKAFYYHGLTIEFDAQIPRLTVDGQEIAVSGMADLSTHALIKHAEGVVNASQDFARRDLIRNKHADLLRSGTDRWNAWRVQNPEIRPLLYEADLNGLDLSGEPTARVNLANANMIRANLSGANLTGANLHEANLGGADLSGAHLEKANLCRTDLYETILRGAHLEEANLQGTQLAKTDFAGAYLSGCRIYGLSAWDIGIDETRQKDLVIVYEKKAAGEGDSPQPGKVIVDDLRLAQFIYLILNNENIKHVFDTTSSKTVLILGRFGDHKPVLEAIREWVREKDLIPILFDFQNPSKDLDETIRVLAGLSRFVIADLSDPQCIPMELEAIVKNNRIPIVPVIENGRPFALSREFHWFWWFLKIRPYSSVDDLRRILDERFSSEIPATEERLRLERTAAAASGFPPDAAP